MDTSLHSFLRTLVRIRENSVLNDSGLWVCKSLHSIKIKIVMILKERCAHLITASELKFFLLKVPQFKYEAMPLNFCNFTVFRAHKQPPTILPQYVLKQDFRQGLVPYHPESNLLCQALPLSFWGLHPTNHSSLPIYSSGFWLSVSSIYIRFISFLLSHSLFSPSLLFLRFPNFGLLCFGHRTISWKTLKSSLASEPRHSWVLSPVGSTTGL